ncbi:Uma2 family endonuclease [Frigoriglobus tundricola]|nr:Uma2 family endonuclease [Frigoriglobus tundricola]
MRELGLFAGRDVELVAGIVRENPGGGPFVFTRTEYYALDANHFFRGQRVQLIGGVILQESPMNPPHAVAVTLGLSTLQTLFGAGHHVRVQLPIDLGLISEPQPDLAVVAGLPREYLTDHPKTALLVVEVSDTTIQEDTHEKASLYASGGIEDYWVIDLTTSRVLVFRSPRPDPKARFGHDHVSLAAYGREDRLSPLAAPDARILGSDLLP